ncbi:BON domain-containing protein [Bdellovibrio sp. 22V]|uniref:BON domain-containing protein n=1 Tax=Bdellovibrio TaxID=958 RepID=UPI00254389FC|nr:BON domain-containing protein [Bdellovibrio sp. 22V]WII70819.1 BON domain-containing protein [Bdellovibrio sp. 22V]
MDEYYYTPRDPRETYKRYERTYDGSLRFKREPEEDFRGKGPKNYVRSDGRIYEEICEVLTLDPDVDASEIDVQVKNGVVTLSGTVETRTLKRYAEDSVSDVFGVKDIINEIRVIDQDPDRKRISEALK